MISNETFEYTVCSNLENVSTLTTEFGPIDVPVGDYIGILTFDWGGDNVTIDARLMQESPPIFDTGSSTNPYPSIAGTHNGTITPSRNLNVSTLYTYPCPGTGGHTEYFKIWNSTDWNVTATWDGYTGDWHNLSFNNTFTLYTNETYNFTIKTGSYPQIHHNRTLLTANGWINCTNFTDANGKKYYDWIPAIRLWAE